MITDPVKRLLAARQRERFATAQLAAARSELGAAVREAWPELLRDERVTELAQELEVTRAFLYRVRDGEAWK